MAVISAIAKARKPES